MVKKRGLKKLFVVLLNIVLLVQLLNIGLFLNPKKAKAANCGGGTPCNCGDTVTTDYTLTSDMVCTDHGLVVGANGITIDGNNHTITGDRDYWEYGIYNSGGYDNVTIKNLTVENFDTGIYFNDSTGSTIENATANDNFNAGIYFYSSSSNNTLTGNIVSNSFKGIFLKFSSSNILTGNIANDNYIGIYLLYSSSNTLTGNTMANNRINLDVGSNDADYNNTIDTTNLVEGKPVYYLYNHSDEIYDSNVIGDIGMFWCISCDNITVKNATLSPNNPAGVYFRNTTNSFIENVTANGNANAGIYFYSSSYNTLTGNIASNNSSYGIYFSDSSTNNTLTSNIASDNSAYGIRFSSDSFNNTLTENLFLFNRKDIYSSSNTYLSNILSHNLESNMMIFNDVERSKNLNDTVSFGISMFDIRGNNCPTCFYDISVSPSDTVSVTKTDNDLSGSFQVAKPGTYSLIAKITDSNNNLSERRYLFFVGSTDSKTTRYYLRGTNPTHGQPAGSDAKALLLSSPSQEEKWSCSGWVQNSPDELLNYPLGILEEVDLNSWYKTDADGYMGIERFVTYSNTMDISLSVSAAADYTWLNRNFSNIDWVMDYLISWYWLSLKLGDSEPFWRTIPSQPSYADFTYSYTTTPAIKSISNENIIILSATTDSVGSNNYSVVLENPLSTAHSTYLTLPDVKRPFINALSQITAAGKNTLTVHLLANETKTLNSVNMEIIPSEGSVTVNIDTWLTSDDYYRKWTEEGSSSNITTQHTIGDLETNTSYLLLIDGIITDVLQSNDAGGVSFTYDQGYSTKTFELYAGSLLPETGADNAKLQKANNINNIISYLWQELLSWLRIKP